MYADQSTRAPSKRQLIAAAVGVVACHAIVLGAWVSHDEKHAQEARQSVSAPSSYAAGQAAPATEGSRFVQATVKAKSGI